MPHTRHKRLTGLDVRGNSLQELRCHFQCGIRVLVLGPATNSYCRVTVHGTPDLGLSRLLEGFNASKNTLDSLSCSPRFLS